MVVVVVQAGVWGTAVERRRDDDILAVRIVSNVVLINKYNIYVFFTLCFILLLAGVPEVPRVATLQTTHPFLVGVRAHRSDGPQPHFINIQFRKKTRIGVMI